MKINSAEINRQILKIAIPNILGNITIPLLGIVDTILMAHKGKDASVLIGAIGLGGLIFNALYWNLNFIRPTTTGITAQAHGAEDRQKQISTLLRALMIATVLAIIILLFYPVIRSVGFEILSNPQNESAIGYAQEYFDVRIWAVPAVLYLFALQGWFYGMQNALIPFILTTFLNLTNIAVSIYCVKFLDMNADGVALGTVVAQYLSLFLSLALLFYYYPWLRGSFRSKRLNSLQGFREFFEVSGFVFGRNVMLFAVFATFTYYSSTLGETYFAANQILLQLFFFMSFAVDGFAYASEALVGKYKGASHARALLRSVRLCLFWGIGFGCLFSLAYSICGSEILGLISPDPSIIASARPYLIWLSVIAISGAISFIWDGVYIGATLALPMFISMSVSTIVFFITLENLHSSYPYRAIWVAMTTYVTMRGIIQWLYFRILWKQGKVL